MISHCFFFCISNIIVGVNLTILLWKTLTYQFNFFIKITPFFSTTCILMKLVLWCFPFIPKQQIHSLIIMKLLTPECIVSLTIYYHQASVKESRFTKTVICLPAILCLARHCCLHVRLLQSFHQFSRGVWSA